MIHMPHRSVTRFFIPLIDVLLLLFCIFLLMPFSNEKELKERRETAADLNAQVTVLEKELDQRLNELQEFDSLRPQLQDLRKLQDELERLRRLRDKSFQQTVIQVIDVDGKTGELSYYDTTVPPDQARVAIADEVTAKKLVEKWKSSAGARDLFLYFLMPRPVTGFPLLAQVRNYRQWFTGTPNSLGEDKRK